MSLVKISRFEINERTQVTLQWTMPYLHVHRILNQTVWCTYWSNNSYTTFIHERPIKHYKVFFDPLSIVKTMWTSLCGNKLSKRYLIYHKGEVFAQAILLPPPFLDRVDPLWFSRKWSDLPVSTICTSTNSNEALYKVWIQVYPISHTGWQTFTRFCTSQMAEPPSPQNASPFGRGET